MGKILLQEELTRFRGRLRQGCVSCDNATVSDEMPLDEISDQVEAGSASVSVIIPCFNQGRFLSQAIESVIGQSQHIHEIIVVNDGSTDNTATVSASYPEVSTISQSNQGLAAARNAGFHSSTGSFLIFLDSDDCLAPTAVETHLRCFADHPKAAFVVGDIDQVSEDGRPSASPRWPLLKGEFYAELLRANHVANTIAVMFKRDALLQIGEYEAAFAPAEDYHLLLRAARLLPSAHHRDVVAFYRRHQDSMSRNGLPMLIAMEKIMRSQYEFVHGNPRLEAAWMEGRRYWQDYFSKTTLRQVFRLFQQGQPGRACSIAVDLFARSRGRVFLLPWKFRKRGFDLLRRTLMRTPQRLD